jgi:aspartate dehydrogenase
VCRRSLRGTAIMLAVEREEQSMTVTSLGIIGAGAITKELLTALSQEIVVPLERLVILTRPTSAAAAAALLAGYGRRLAKAHHVETSLETFVATRLDLVVECAGHSAVNSYAEPLLLAGRPMIIVSTGALTDDGVRERLILAARTGRTQFALSSGAIGGLDLIAAARLAGLESVSYTSRKPPSAWRGTPAESVIDLDSIAVETVFFMGNARAAARDYPKNANVAATVAFAAGSLDTTHVRLIADPASPGNVHEISIQSRAGRADIRIVNAPSPDNPKTSLATGYALAREVLNRMSVMAV